MGDFKPDPKLAPPAYMVSFCDMMTLILTFFILLVSMAKERQNGLLAAGVGSFIIAVESHGMPGIMSGAEKAAVFDNLRRRFNVPQDADPELATDAMDASNLELIRTKLSKAMKPHNALPYPGVVQFAPGSAEVPKDALPYLDLLAPSLQPKHRQLLVVEGHANDAAQGPHKSDYQLAFARASAIRTYLIETFGVPPDRIEARAWLVELPSAGQVNRSVDIRLITPGS
jgi:chemotaxis protein MotB